MNENRSDDQTRHVFLCADANYVVPLVVTLRSLTETQDEPSLLCVTILSSGIPQGDQDRIQASVPQLALRFVSIEEHLSSDIPPEDGHLTSAAYGRLFGVDTLPSGTLRAIYLDSDLIVTTDIGFLFSFDLKGAPIAAVPSPGAPHVSNPNGLAQWRSLGMSPCVPYMNSGVLVIDVVAWRMRDLGRVVLDFVRNNRAHGQAIGDQDGFNGVLAGGWAALPLRWNQEAPLRRNSHLAYSFFSRDEVDHAIDDPAIIHFTGRPKPWSHPTVDPAAPLWFDLLERTEYRNWNYEKPPKPFRTKIHYVVGRLLRV